MLFCGVKKLVKEREKRGLPRGSGLPDSKNPQRGTPRGENTQATAGDTFFTVPVKAVTNAINASVCDY